MKDKISGALGFFGIILWYLLSLIVCFAPIIMLDPPYIVSLLLIGIILFVPYIGEIVRGILYVIAFIVVIRQPIDVFSVVFFISFVLYIFVFAGPLVKATIETFREKTERKKDGKDL